MGGEDEGNDKDDSFLVCHFSNGGGCPSLMWNFRHGGQWVLASGAGRKP